MANRRGIGAVAAAATDVRRNTTKYADSVESVYRHVIQKQKNDMASEIIDAGRFDQNTTNEERKETLEQILADADRNRVAKNEVPTWHWIHRRLARGEHEIAEFERIDAQMEWFPPTDLENVPAWVRFTAEDIQAAVPERKRRRGELEDPVMVGSAWGAQEVCFFLAAHVCALRRNPPHPGCRSRSHGTLMDARVLLLILSGVRSFIQGGWGSTTLTGTTFASVGLSERVCRLVRRHGRSLLNGSWVGDVAAVSSYASALSGHALTLGPWPSAGAAGDLGIGGWVGDTIREVLAPPGPALTDVQVLGSHQLTD